MKAWKMLLPLAVLLAVTLGGCTTVFDETAAVSAGGSWSLDVSEFDECNYDFTVRQTGNLGDVDIRFQGQKYREKEGIFRGDTFTLDNGYSLLTTKVVDVRLECS